MKFFHTLIPITLVIFMACQPKTSSTSSTDAAMDTTAVAAKGQRSNMTCYQGTINQDTFQLKVQRGENLVTGMLAYLFSQKDKSSGHLRGQQYGDTLIADYTYFSEGKASVRQVAFLLSGDEAIEGYGPQKDYEGKMQFATRSKITFGSGVKMQKGDCDAITIVVPKPLIMMKGGLGGTWELEFIAGTNIPTDKLYPGKKPQLTFVTNQPTDFSGNSGCNNLHGKCRANASGIQFMDPVALTRMACEGQGEQAFVDMLKKINRYSIEDGKLHLRIDDKVMIRLVRK